MKTASRRRRSDSRWCGPAADLRGPITAILLAGAAVAATTTGQEPGIAGRQAPSWKVDRWHNLPAERDRLDVSDFAGKVVYLFCFQSWCPGCHSHGFPTLTAVHERFADDEDVAFVAIQTVFEGFASNTADDGKRTLAEYGLSIPWAQAAGRERSPPAFMRDYRTGGTPWTIIIGTDGKVRFNGFGIEPRQAIALVERLRPAVGERTPAREVD